CGDTACPAYRSRERRLARYPRLSPPKLRRPAAGLSARLLITSRGPFTHGSLSTGLGARPRVASAASTVPPSKIAPVAGPTSSRRHCWNHRNAGRPAGSATGCIASELCTAVSNGSSENQERRPDVALAAVGGNV